MNTMEITKVVGCGGIGKGLLFISPVNETLGRSESRLVVQSDAKDYCKQQIVFYYISLFLKDKASVYPIGAVGNDSWGEEILRQMKKQGMHMDCVKKVAAPTMLSICLQYPDKEGCNFTAQNSAAGEVSPEFIEDAMEKIGVDSHTCLVAIPEISVESRSHMLELGKRKGAICVLSVPAAEAKEFEKAGTYAFCDLIAVNEEEAKAMTGSEKTGKELTAELLSYLQNWQQDIRVCVTFGKKGACLGEGSKIEAVQAFPAKTVNTTGAGDAFLGTLVSGLILGLPFFKEREDETFGGNELRTAPELAALCAGLAVESEDSIPEHITVPYIRAMIKEHNWKQRLFTEISENL